MTSSYYSILVADDEPEVVQTLADSLENVAQRFGDSVEIHQTNSASGALRILSRQRIDVLFLDYRFQGGMTGADVISRIRDPFAAMFVVLISGQPESDLEEIIVDGRRRLGTRFRFLRKPFDLIEIKDAYLGIQHFFSDLPYPFPLAYAQDVLFASSTAQGEIMAMANLLEAIASYSVAILLSDLERLNLLEQAALHPAPVARLTLMNWLEWLYSLLRCPDLTSEVAFVPEIIDLFERPDSDYLEFMRRFAHDIERSDASRGFVKEEGWYALQVRKYRHTVEALVRDSAFLARYLLLVPERMEFAPDNPDEINYSARLLMGSESRFPLRCFRTRARLRHDEVYLANASARWLSLHPFLKFAVCQQCSLGRVYLLDEIRTQSLVYGAICNHRVPDKKARIAFDTKYAKLRLDTEHDTTTLVTKRRIGSQFEVREIRDTNHSRVVKAWDKSLERMVAIKSVNLERFKPDPFIRKKLQSNLLREARIIAKLRHPYIGQVHAVVLDPLGVVLEWIDGLSLGETLAKEGKLPVGQVAKIGLQISDALRYVHGQDPSVVHRDIKPNNIIISHRGDAILIDFDVAHSADRETISLAADGRRGFVGTVAYAAPEQLQGGQAEPPADMFALGLVLYEASTGQHPFPGGNDPTKYSERCLPPLAPEGLPEHLFTVISMLLRTDPRERPTAEQLQATLSKYLIEDQIPEDIGQAT